MKVGIFSGTFDPVHAGHIAFALEAARQAELDKVYFLPERSPRRKEGVTHYAHRLAMLKLALRPYERLEVLELPDKQFSVSRTLPRIKRITGSAELYQLVGSDVIELMSSTTAGQQWPGLRKYLREVTLIVGARSGAEAEKLRVSLRDIQPNGLITKSHHAGVSSSAIRLAIGRGKIPGELLTSLRPYVERHWLYVSIDGVAAKSSL